MANDAVPDSRLLIRTLALLLALLGVLAFVVRGYHDEAEALHFRDFKQPYSSSRCLLERCDPYSETDTRAAFLAAGGSDIDKIVFDPYSALYPPFSLVVLAPIAALPYPVAHTVWEALIAATFSLAVFLVADLCVTAGAWLPAVLLLVVFSATSTILLMLGQISGFVLSLLVIGFACLLRERLLWLAAVCLFLAVMLKPHDAALPMLYLLCAGPRWRRVFWVVLVASLLCLAGSLFWFAHAPGTAHWAAELGANLHGNASAGSVNDPARGHTQALYLTNLQALFAVLQNQARFYNLAAFTSCVVLLAAWLVPVVQLRNAQAKHLLAIAAIACFTLLPIYHRQYDTRIFLLAFPAVALMMARPGHRLWGALGCGLLALATVVTANPVLNELTQHGQLIAEAGAGTTLLLFRPLPEITLLLFLYFLVSLLQAWRAQRMEEGARATAYPAK